MHLHHSRSIAGGTHAAFALLIAGLVAVGSVPIQAQKGKPPADATVTVTFADRTDGSGAVVDGLSSDTGQPYPGGILYVVSGDLRLDVTSGSREIVVRLGTPETVAPGVGSVPSGQTYYTDTTLYIQAIASVPRGTTETRVGRIGLGSAYPDHALGFRYTTSQGIVINGTPVCVTRRNIPGPGAIWDITSSCAGESSDIAGFFEENLKGKVNHRFKATYAVPFAATVTCTANCPQ